MKKSQEKALYSIPGWEDFLSADLARQYRSFAEARIYARNLNLNGRGDWEKVSQSGERPDDIPSSPNRTYKDSGWISWGDFLGTGNVNKKNFRPFEETKKVAYDLKLNGMADWQEWSKSDKRPDDIPSTPDKAYKDSWISWGDFLGTGNIATYNRKFRSFEDAREFARDLKLNSQSDWENLCKSGEKPDDIPSLPSFFYKDFGWISWGDFLGTGNVATRNKKFRSFEKARLFVRNLNLNSWSDWREWCKSGERPKDIPAHPNIIYKDSGWVSLGDWLGN
jgi:hypothetical protein